MQLTIEHQEELRFAAACGNHRLTIDLPEPLGGTDRGMTPPQLFVASLGACLGVYVVDYCETIGVPSQGLKVHMRWEQSDRPKRIGRIHAQIDIPHAGITPARRAAIQRVAEQCLLHNTLKEMPAFDIAITTADEAAIDAVPVVDEQVVASQAGAHVEAAGRTVRKR